MNLSEFITHRGAQQTTDWNSHEDFETFVRLRHEDFLKLIDQLDRNSVSDEVQRRKPAIISCCEELQRSLRSSLEGRPHEAYGYFDTAMKSIQPEIEACAVNVNDPNDLLFLYRVRQTQSAANAVDLFHIPFELRHLVATQRYSIPGLPCLYLAGSLYTCWEEMGRPPLHELQCAAFWVKRGKSMKLLNLSARLEPNMMTNDLSTRPEPNILTEIVLWPLVFSSSIKVKHRNAPFKPEYIIPQMVLQWVTQNQELDGVIYFSTHVRAAPTKWRLAACNVAIPAKQVTAAGRCKQLCDKFKMTSPVGWQLLSSINVDDGTVVPFIPRYDLEFIEGVEEPYSETEFGKVETKLNSLANRTMQRNEDGDATKGDVSPDAAAVKWQD